MEKMFVYPETLDWRVAREMQLEDVPSPYSRADVASHRCKLYRTLLEQRTASGLEQRIASRHAALAGMDNDRATSGAHA